MSHKGFEGLWCVEAVGARTLVFWVWGSGQGRPQFGPATHVRQPGHDLVDSLGLASIRFGVELRVT